MINIEQLVYGTFAFTQGFTLVSASPGLTRPVSRRIVEVCKAWGEVHTQEFKHALYHVPLLMGDEDDEESEPTGPPLHLIGKVTRQGEDQSGSRMAWHQQVLAISHQDYLTAGADLFSFDKAGIFKDRWFESDECSTLTMDPAVLPRLDRTQIPASHYDLIDRMARALLTDHEVRVPAPQASRAVSTLFREVLNLLPLEIRSLVGLTTFAFRPPQRYDLWCLYESGGTQVDQAENASVHLESKDEVWDTEWISFVDEDSQRLLDRALGLLRAGQAADLNDLLDAG